MPESLTRKRNGRAVKRQALSYPEGTELLEQARKTRRLYRLIAGQVRLTGRNGVIFDHLKKGAFLGERFLVDASPNGQGAMALSPVEVVPFRKGELLAELRRDPDFALKLVGDLASRLERYEDLICDLVTEQAEMRLARLLLRYAPSRPAAGWVNLPFRFTNMELAKMIGTTRWRISFLLNRFQRFGWLRRDEKLWLQRQGVLDFLAGT